MPATLCTNGRPELFQGVMIDVTARKEAEAKARKTELRYRSLAGRALGSFEADADEP
jgi:hypothetical protein